MRNPAHPTRELLIATTVDMLDSRDVDHLNINEVLQVSGISKGSMYHHFTDFSDLINAALVRRFGRGVDTDIARINEGFANTSSAEQFLDVVEQLSVQIHTPERANARAERAAILARARQNDALCEALAAEQHRLTMSLADLIEEAQRRGWATKDVDPVATATFLQAFTLGQMVNDVLVKSTEFDSMDYSAWHSLVHRVITSLRA
jgi:AcrR family transcriptional regulator